MAVVPMLALPPARFSTTTVAPSFSCSTCPASRHCVRASAGAAAPARNVRRFVLRMVMLVFAQAGKPLRVETDMPFKCNQPAVPTVQQDDATVRITRWDFAPGAATGWHTHGWPYFVVLLTDAVMKIEVGGGVTETRLTAGQSYQRPPGIDHNVMNGSHQPMAFVE